MELPDMRLTTQGLGMIMYSFPAVRDIPIGSNYFSSNYTTGADVARHIHEGSIVGFCTSSSGRFILSFKQGYPPRDVFDAHEFKIRLGIKVQDNQLYIRDLYDLMRWTPNCPSTQVISIEDGFYHITLCTNVPFSGALGDEQVILVYFQKLQCMPELTYTGVPILCE